MCRRILLRSFCAAAFNEAAAAAAAAAQCEKQENGRGGSIFATVHTAFAKSLRICFQLLLFFLPSLYTHFSSLFLRNRTLCKDNVLIRDVILSNTLNTIEMTKEWTRFIKEITEFVYTINLHTSSCLYTAVQSRSYSYVLRHTTRSTAMVWIEKNTTYYNTSFREFRFLMLRVRIFIHFAANTI